MGNQIYEQQLEEHKKLSNILESKYKITIQELAGDIRKKQYSYNSSNDGRFFLESYIYGQIILHRTNCGTSGFLEKFKEYINKGELRKAYELAPSSMFLNYMTRGKTFQMKNSVFELLKNTSNKIFNRNQPFPIFGIDQQIEPIANVKILFSMFFAVEDGGSNYLVIGIDKRDKSEFYLTGGIGKKDFSKEEESSFWDKGELRIIRKEINLMYCNFLDYLNTTRCKQTFYKLSNNNNKRIKRGQFPIQDKISIDIDSSFFNNIKMNQPKCNMDYSSRFWVRGHFRHFRNKIRFNKIYNMDMEELQKKDLFMNGEFLSRWISPHIKGEGELKQKLRVVN